MTRKISVFGLVLVAVACAPGVEEVGNVGVVVSAIGESCSGQSWPNPTTDMTSIEVIVTGPDRETGETVTLANPTVPVVDGMATVKIEGLPAGVGNTVTLLGYSNDSAEPVWFGRKRDVSIVANRSRTESMVLNRFGSTSCVTPPDGWNERMFSSSVALGDGRILITGGFTGYDSGNSLLTTPSKVAVIYDPTTGKATRVGDMNSARAAHAMAFVSLPEGDRVVVFGGATSARLSFANNGVPLDLVTGTLDSFEVFDVENGVFVPAVDENGAEKKMALPRAFFSAVSLYDNSILLMGGGAWPFDVDGSYQMPEIWLPTLDAVAEDESATAEETVSTGSVLGIGEGLIMNSQHNGAAVTKLEDTEQALSRYLIVGGAVDSASTVEIFTQSSKQGEGAGGAFKQVSSTLPRIYFPTLTALRNHPDGAKRFLLSGGIIYSSKEKVGKNWRLIGSINTKTYLLSVAANDTLSVVDVPDSTYSCEQRLFGSVTAAGSGDRAVIIGGYSDLSGNVNRENCYLRVRDRLSVTRWEVSTGCKTWSYNNDIENPLYRTVTICQVSPAEYSWSTGFEWMTGTGAMNEQARAGQRVEALPDDSILVTGGINGMGSLGTGVGVMEVFAPSIINVELAEPLDMLDDRSGQLVGQI